MVCESMALEDLVDIMTGTPISRARKNSAKGKPMQAAVLLPAAMSDNDINNDLLSIEMVSSVKEELFTRKDDIIVKASTPYDCAFIDEEHADILVTSFALILRAKADSRVDMRFLAAFFSLDTTKKQLQVMSKGSKNVLLIKKRDLAELVVPVPPRTEQERIARIYEETRTQIKLCHSIERKSDLLLKSTVTSLITSE